MKTLQISFAALALMFAVSCGNSNSDSAATTDEQQVAEQTGVQYNAVAGSTINWTGVHKGGTFPRYGTINITEGTIAVENGNVTGGNFNIDMSTLTVNPESVTEPGKNYMDLQNHLKSPEFFNVDSFGTAKFEITGVTAFDATKDESKLEGATNIVSGNLTLKGQTLNVTFPAIITITETDATVKANFSVDRTAWGLNFGTEGSPENWMVSKDLEIAFDIKATK